MTRPKLLIIGHGMVAQRLLQTLVSRTDNPWQITVIGDESHTAYNRVLLSPLLAGEINQDQLALATAGWHTQHRIHCHRGDPVVHIDRPARQVRTLSGQIFDYDRLVLATGSRAASLGIPGEDLPGVFSFRDLADTHALIEASRTHRRAVVIGGGFLGIEAAEGLRKRGMSVTLLHRSGHLLNRQLDPTAAGLLEAELVSRGLRVRLNARPARLVGRNCLRAVELADGTVISTDLVIIAAGITPRMTLGQEAGLLCERAICVDDQLRSSDPDIHALGECCQFQGETYGLVEPIYRQAEVLARVLCGINAHYNEMPVATRLKISGVNLFSCGQIEPDQDSESLIFKDHDQGDYRHLLMKGGKLVGAILYGDVSAGSWYFDQVMQATDLHPWRAQLVFGAAFCDLACDLAA